MTPLRAPRKIQIQPKQENETMKRSHIRTVEKVRDELLLGLAEDCCRAHEAERHSELNSIIALDNVLRENAGHTPVYEGVFKRHTGTNEVLRWTLLRLVRHARNLDMGGNLDEARITCSTSDAFIILQGD